MGHGQHLKMAMDGWVVISITQSGIRFGEILAYVLDDVPSP